MNREIKHRIEFKIILISTLIFVFVNESLYSQVKFGLGIGPNYSGTNYFGNPLGRWDITGKYGLTAGILTEWPISNFVFLQMELNYVKKTVSFSTTDNSLVTNNVLLTKNYLELPLHMKLKPWYPYFRPYLFYGLNTGYLLSATVKDDSFYKFCLGLDIGGGMEYRLSSSFDLFANFKYSIGITKINKDDQFYPNNDGWQTNIGLKFNIPWPKNKIDTFVIIVRDTVLVPKIIRVIDTIILTKRELCRKIKEFNFNEFRVPFFVTGHYYLNTRNNLSIIKSLLGKGPYESVTYIDRIDQSKSLYDKYLNWAITVEQLIDTVKDYINNYLLNPATILSPNEKIEIKIIGYTDQRTVTGHYLENDLVKFEGPENFFHTKEYGDTISNYSLSGLRACYAKIYLDTLFHKNKRFQDLKEKGKIIYTMVAGGINFEEEQMEYKRNIKILFNRIESK